MLKDLTREAANLGLEQENVEPDFKEFLGKRGHQLRDLVMIGANHDCKSMYEHCPNLKVERSPPSATTGVSSPPLRRRHRVRQLPPIHGTAADQCNVFLAQMPRALHLAGAIVLSIPDGLRGGTT